MVRSCLLVCPRKPVLGDHYEYANDERRPDAVNHSLHSQRAKAVQPAPAGRPDTARAINQCELQWLFLHLLPLPCPGRRPIWIGRVETAQGEVPKRLSGNAVCDSPVGYGADTGHPSRPSDRSPWSGSSRAESQNRSHRAPGTRSWAVTAFGRQEPLQQDQLAEMLGRPGPVRPSQAGGNTTCPLPLHLVHCQTYVPRKWGHSRTSFALGFPPDERAPIRPVRVPVRVRSDGLRP